MILIAQPQFLTSINIAEYTSIVILASEKDSMPIEAAKALLQAEDFSFAQLPPKTDEITTALILGKIIGAYGDFEDATVLVTGEKLKKALTSAGVKTSVVIKKKTAATKSSKAKPAVPAPSKESRDLQANAGEEVKPAPKRKSPPKVTAKQEISDNAGPAPKKNARKRLSGQGFEEILKECGVKKEEMAGVRQAVLDAGEEISYEMRLRINVPGAARPAEIYERTRSRFKELKALL